MEMGRGGVVRFVVLGRGGVRSTADGPYALYSSPPSRISTVDDFLSFPATTIECGQLLPHTICKQLLPSFHSEEGRLRGGAPVSKYPWAPRSQLEN